MITERAKIIRAMDKKWNKLCEKKVREAMAFVREDLLKEIEELQKRGWEKSSILDSIIGKLFGDIQRGGE